MKFNTSFLLLLASTLTSSLPLNTRDANAVLSDISSISSDVNSLDGDVKGFDGSIFSALGLLIGVNNLKSSLTGGTSDASSSSAFSDAESASIVAALQALVPGVTTTLTDLNGKASVVASAGYTSLVLSNLQELHSDADALLSAIGAKVDSGDAAAVTSVQASIDAAFSASEAVY